MKKLYVLTIFVIFFIVAIAYLYVGPIHFYVWNMWSTPSPLIALLFHMRLERLATAYIIGAILAICGVVMQNLFRNPIADPYILGVSSGAGMGVAVAMFLASLFPILGGFTFTMFCAFFFSIVSSFIALYFSRVNGQVILTRLLLVGMALTFFEGAFIQIIFSVNVLKNFNIFLWLMGSLDNANFGSTVVLLITLIVIAVIFFLFHRSYDLLLLGHEIAHSSGVRVERVKWISLILVSLAVALVVSYCGIIGFVGMIVPHAIRIVIGPKNLKLMLYSMLLGAVFVALCDMVSTSVITPSELPLGAVIGIIGAPYFIILLVQMNRGKRA